MTAWPQYLILSLYVVSIAFTAYLHGDRKTGYWDVRETIISSGVGAWLLWMGGFWEPLSAGAP